MNTETRNEQSYQWMLRSLGAFLDQEPSCRLSLAEVPDGFVVRMQRALHKLEPVVLHFNRDTLTEQLEQLMGQRKRAAVTAHHQGVWSHFPNGHQDFLRALGYELDQSHAEGILIDELEDSVAVTYAYPDAEDARWRKRIIVLSLTDIEEILNAAFERRHLPARAGEG